MGAGRMPAPILVLSLESTLAESPPSAPSNTGNRVALITGAAKGIGAETARVLRERGYDLGLIDVDAEPLEKLARVLGPEHCETAVADVTDQASIDAATVAVAERFGGIDVCMANAGIGSYGTAASTDPEAFARVIDINLTGVFRTVHASLPHITERRGYILVVCSLASYAHMPGMTAYDASKAGAEHFANSLRLEVAHLGVDVGSAHMSWIDTPLVRSAANDMSMLATLRDNLPGPLGRTTSVERCARKFADGIESRRSRIFVPGWVALAHWFRPLLSTRVAELEQRRLAPEILPQMDAEMGALGRSLTEADQAAAERARERAEAEKV